MLVGSRVKVAVGKSSVAVSVGNTSAVELQADRINRVTKKSMKFFFIEFYGTPGRIVSLSRHPLKKFCEGVSHPE